MMHLWMGGLCFYIIVINNIGCRKQRETRNGLASLMIFILCIFGFFLAGYDIMVKNFFMFGSTLTGSFDIFSSILGILGILQADIESLLLVSLFTFLDTIIACCCDDSSFLLETPPIVTDDVDLVVFEALMKWKNLIKFN